MNRQRFILQVDILVNNAGLALGKKGLQETPIEVNALHLYKQHNVVLLRLESAHLQLLI